MVKMGIFSIYSISIGFCNAISHVIGYIMTIIQAIPSLWIKLCVCVCVYMDTLLGWEIFDHKVLIYREVFICIDTENNS